MLSCGNVGKTYPTERGDVDAVKGIDLEVPRGRKVGVTSRISRMREY